MKIFFSVGEPSGDLHGANLIRELRRRRPDCEFVGYGGPRMAAAGCALHEDLTKLAVMWLLHALLNIHKFWNLACRADRYFRHHQPDAVVLIDYPGFNWWIARRAKAHGIPVFYYGVPQMWAWAGWRMKKMRRFVDHVLCKLPFEEAWYRDRGCNATFVGHPYFDQLRAEQLDAKFIDAAASRRRAARGHPARLADAGSEEQPRVFFEGGQDRPRSRAERSVRRSRRSRQARPSSRGMRLPAANCRLRCTSAARRRSSRRPIARWRFRARCRWSCSTTRSRR